MTFVLMWMKLEVKQKPFKNILINLDSLIKQILKHVVVVIIRNSCSLSTYESQALNLGWKRSIHKAPSSFRSLLNIFNPKRLSLFMISKTVFPLLRQLRHLLSLLSNLRTDFHFQDRSQSFVEFLDNMVLGNLDQDLDCDLIFYTCWLNTLKLEDFSQRLAWQLIFKINCRICSYLLHLI